MYDWLRRFSYLWRITKSRKGALGRVKRGPEVEQRSHESLFDFSFTAVKSRHSEEQEKRRNFDEDFI